MSTNIVDRRNSPKGNSSENRHRLLKRIEGQIKKALPDIVKNTNVKDLTSSKERVNIPIKGINEPQFGYDRNTGDKKWVHPGNKDYVEGDRIKKPESGGGKGSGRGKGSNDPSVTEDDFTISISREEFLDYFFADLELPDMVKKHLASIVDFKRKRAGYSNHGNPSRLNITRSYKNSMARRMALSMYFDKKIKDLEEKLKAATADEAIRIQEEIDKLKKMKLGVSFMEEVDLQYNNFEKVPVPTTSAVMFCILDVSGSMGEKEKDIAKRFFMLLYMFLTKQYETIEIVFIRHHTSAKEVTEEEFFNSRESGGTVVYSALELMAKIIKERYSKDWNIYAAQASDGDVWDRTDAFECYSILDKDILNSVQYMTYIEICRPNDGDLWNNYKLLSDKRKNFEIGKINEVGEIWKVFQDFFKKKTA